MTKSATQDSRPRNNENKSASPLNKPTVWSDVLGNTVYPLTKKPVNNIRWKNNSGIETSQTAIEIIILEFIYA